MQHISLNVREVGKKSYWATDDANIFTQLTTTQQFIHKDKLEKKIANLETIIAGAKTELAYPKGASDEVKEAIDMYNEHLDDTDAAEELLQEKQALLDNISE